MNFRIEEKFPLEWYSDLLSKKNKNIIIVSDDSLLFLISRTNISYSELQSFRNGPLVFSLFVEDNIPFFVIKTTKGIFDFSLNMSKYNQLSSTEQWLASTNRNVSIILLESNDLKKKFKMEFEFIMFDHLREIIRNQILVNSNVIDSRISQKYLENSITDIENKSVTRQILI